MLRFNGKILYRDGRSVSFEAGLAATAAWEEYAHRNGYPFAVDLAPRVLYTLVIAHAALGIEEGFEVWRPKVDTFELEAVEVPPTLTVATDGSA
jgi:hypothetical protein